MTESSIEQRASVTVHDEFCIERTASPCGVVLFGASGDLAARKLIPSLYHLFQSGLLSERFYVLGVARTPMDDAGFRNKVQESLDRFAKFGPVHRADWDRFEKQFHYLTGGYDDPATYKKLAGLLDELDRTHGTGGNRVFYLSTPPDVYGPVVARLGEAGLNRAGAAKVVIEKPFGRDLESAKALSREIAGVFREDQVYRIDHYLGKETVQNVLILRFANLLFEPVWNRNYVDHVQITVAESDGVGYRAGYYERSGALRDMAQNHMLQLLCLIAMEPPSAFNAEEIREEKTKVMRAVRPIRDASKVAVRGQYSAGEIEGKAVPGYRQEKGVAPGSRTETFFAFKTFVDNWRWQDVPFYLRTGKRLPRKVSEIDIRFKRVPHLVFDGIPVESLSPNALILRIQPDEGVSLRFETKHPGPKLCMSSVDMDFAYRESFGMAPPEAYERLLLDCMSGDQTLFARRDWVELSWAYLASVQKQWESSDSPLSSYAAGSWGPEEAERLIGSDGRRWREI